MQVTNNCALALKIDENSSKALYRRAYALVAKKDHEVAKADLLLAQKSAPGDKAVATLLKKVGAPGLPFAGDRIVPGSV